MSIERAVKFLWEVVRDPDIEVSEDRTNPAGLLELAEQKGYSLTEEDLRTAVRQLLLHATRTAELSDEVLEGVDGGAGFSNFNRQATHLVNKLSSALGSPGARPES